VDVGDVILGILAVLIGLLLTFRGYAALRLVIAAWGGFAGFVLGGTAVASFTGQEYLGTPLGWIVALVTAVVFALVAYLYYAVSVIIGMGAIGFALGTTLMVALGVEWSWLVVLVGLALGVGLALIAVIGDLPLLILAVLSAFAGASTLLGGLLLLFGILDTGDIATDAAAQPLELGWWWTVAYVVLGVVGVVAQLRDVEARRGTLRAAWRGDAARPAV
jgi:hypothetical protein